MNEEQENQARKIKRLVEEIIALSEQCPPPEDYYREFWKRVVLALEAPAGAVWIRNSQGSFILQTEMNIQQVGLDASEEGRRSHDELIRAAALKGERMIIPSHGSFGQGSDDRPAP